MELIHPGLLRAWAPPSLLLPGPAEVGGAGHNQAGSSLHLEPHSRSFEVRTWTHVAILSAASNADGLRVTWSPFPAGVKLRARLCSLRVCVPVRKTQLALDEWSGKGRRRSIALPGHSHPSSHPSSLVGQPSPTCHPAHPLSVFWGYHPCPHVPYRISEGHSYPRSFPVPPTAPPTNPKGPHFTRYCTGPCS